MGKLHGVLQTVDVKEIARVDSDRPHRIRTVGAYIVSVVAFFFLPARGGRFDQFLAGLVVAPVQMPLHDIHRLLQHERTKEEQIKTRWLNIREGF